MDLLFRVTFRILHLSGWKCINQSCSHLPAASKSDLKKLSIMYAFNFSVYMMLSSCAVLTIISSVPKSNETCVLIILYDCVCLLS